MARILCLLLGLLAAAWIACGVHVPPGRTAEDSGPGWRRTAHGWERKDLWYTAEPPGPPPLSPVVVGLLEAILSVMALVAFCPATRTPRRPPRRGRDPSGPRDPGDAPWPVAHVNAGP